MKSKWIALAVTALLGGPMGTAAQTPSQHSRSLAAGAMVGFASGVSLQGQLLAGRLASSLPVEVRLRLGYTRLDPGSSSAARRIFINNATNGTPEESGRVLDLDLDVLWGSSLLPGEEAFWWAGIRHSRFKGNFRFVGGNEDFDVTSTHWGLGAGAESRFSIGRRTWLVVDAGVDLFPRARLHGHDTSYSPDGDNVNPREDFGYSDADDAINQPRLRPVLLVGFQRLIGR